MSIASVVIAAFTSPMTIGTNPLSTLWILPLAAAIAIVYKATKLVKIKPSDFIKEVAILWGTIVVCMIAAGVVLFVLAWAIVG